VTLHRRNVSLCVLNVMRLKQCRQSLYGIVYMLGVQQGA